MGSAASFYEQPPEVQKEIYRKIAELYDEEYLPRLENNDLRNGEGFAMFRKRFEQLMAETPLTDPTPAPAPGSSGQRPQESKEDSSAPGGSGSAVESPAHALSSFYSTFMVGDVVKVRQGFMMFEGVVVEVPGGNCQTLDVDFGDDIETVPLDHCCLVMNGLDFEVGDYVSACPAGELYFNGRITSINSNGTFDILFDGDDPEDVERNIRPDMVRKIRTGRQLVLNRWQKAKNLVSMSLAWASVARRQGSEDSKGGEDEESQGGEGKGWEEKGWEEDSKGGEGKGGEEEKGESKGREEKGEEDEEKG